MTTRALRGPQLVRGVRWVVHAFGPSPRTRWLMAPGGILLTSLVLFGAATLGVAFRSFGPIAASPGGGPLEYGRGPAGGFAPLRAEFIEGVLGYVVSPRGDGSGDVAASPRGNGAPARVLEAHALTNDDLEDARSIRAIPFTATTNTHGASREPEEASDCGSLGGTVWYRYTPDRDLALIAYTFGTDHTVALGVFTDPPGSERAVGCDTDTVGNALVAFSAKAGRPYFFQITAPLGGGKLVFSLDPHGTITRASVSSSGAQANGPAASGATMSADGRYVTFVSSATNLAEGIDSGRCVAGDPLATLEDGKTCSQVYVRDRVDGTTALVSRSSAGAPGNSDSAAPFVPASGRYIVFESMASNLVPGDERFTWDVFVHDLTTGRTQLIPARGGLPLDSARSDFNGFFLATISADGRYVAFQSPASDLVEADTNGAWDVFVHDRGTGSTDRVSVSSSGEQSHPPPSSVKHDLAPSISADGRFVEFRSQASDLVDGDTNGVGDSFVHDRLTGITERISVSSSGVEGNGETPSDSFIFQKQRISADGRYVAFASTASNLVPDDTNEAIDVFVHDRNTRRTVRVSVSSLGEQAKGHRKSTGVEPGTVFVVGTSFSISLDGRYVAFNSTATNLAAGDGDEESDVFMHDLLTQTTTLITLSPTGGDGSGWGPSVSGDGRFVAFYSLASNLVEGDTNTYGDIFVYEAPRLR